MTDPPTNADRGPITGTPRWVKVFGLVALVVLLVFVILLVTGRGGEHGPGRHALGGDTGLGHTGPPPGVTHPEEQP